MKIHSITLNNFRSYDDVTVSFDDAITFITGKNGSGKTNLLEAIYMLLYGTSFRAGDSEVMKHDTSWWKVAGSIDESQRELRYQVDHTPPKQLVIHDTKKRFTYRERLPVVLFEPSDLLIISGSPTRRRTFLDTVAKTLIPGYQQLLSKYERTLKQRAALLKRHGQQTDLSDMLFVWDVTLSELGAQIIEYRQSCIEQLNIGLTDYYSQLAGRETNISIVYETRYVGEGVQTKLLSALHKNLNIDRLRHTTSVGPHRDDIGIYIDGEMAKLTASRGEVRSIVLALKATYSRAIEAAYGTSPILLLDDVYSELDTDRQSQLAELFSDQQLIISDTKSHSGGKTIKL